MKAKSNLFSTLTLNLAEVNLGKTKQILLWDAL